MNKVGGNGRVKMKLKPTQVRLSSEGDRTGDLPGSGNVTLELKPDSVDFSSSEVSSEQRKEMPFRISAVQRTLVYLRLATEAENNPLLRKAYAQLRLAYTVPDSFQEFCSILGEAASKICKEFGNLLSKSTASSGDELYKAWTHLEYLLNNDSRDPREVIIEYQDTLTDAITSLREKYNEDLAEGKEPLTEDADNDIVEAFLSPFRDDITTASVHDTHQVLIPTDSGPKIIKLIREAMRKLPSLDLKERDIRITHQPVFPTTRKQITWDVSLNSVKGDVTVEASFTIIRFADKTYAVSLVARESKPLQSRDQVRPPSHIANDPSKLIDWMDRRPTHSTTPHTQEGEADDDEQVRSAEMLPPATEGTVVCTYRDRESAVHQRALVDGHREVSNDDLYDYGDQRVIH
jgi:hypothetical protein